MSRIPLPILLPALLSGPRAGINPPPLAPPTLLTLSVQGSARNLGGSVPSITPVLGGRKPSLGGSAHPEQSRRVERGAPHCQPIPPRRHSCGGRNPSLLKAHPPPSRDPSTPFSHVIPAAESRNPSLGGAAHPEQSRRVEREAPHCQPTPSRRHSCGGRNPSLLKAHPPPSRDPSTPFSHVIPAAESRNPSLEAARAGRPVPSPSDGRGLGP